MVQLSLTMRWCPECRKFVIPGCPDARLRSSVKWNTPRLAELFGCPKCGTLTKEKESMSKAAILRLWQEHGGQFLYDLAGSRIRQQRRTAGMPGGYSADPTEYRRDRVEEVLSAYIGVLDGDKLHYRMMGELDGEGCQGAAANHELLAAGNERQAEKFRQLAAALRPGERLGQLDREVLIRIWWGE